MTTARTRVSLATFLVGALAVFAWALVAAGPASSASVTPTFVAGNPSCTSLGYDFGFKVDPPNAGTYDLAGVGTITVTRNGEAFSWTSTFGIDAVIAKGGPNASVYVYNPESLGDTNLTAPINNGQPFGLSHIEFCYDLNLEVSKTANTSFDRDWAWQITKDGDDESTAEDPALIDGVDFNVEYTVTLSAGKVDSNYAVSGTISVHNPAPFTATGVSVSDQLSDGTIATVDCGGATTIAAGATLQCTYTASVADADSGVNTATATATNLDGGLGTANYAFAATPTNETDECVNVTDLVAEGLPTELSQTLDAQLCANELVNGEKTFTYQRDVLDFIECGSNLTNTASFVTNDNAETGDADHTVYTVCADEGNGCTLTQGYWKTHSSHGPAKKADATWAAVGGPDAAFYLSGKTWYQAFWTAPAGNAYYVLAHQFMAATLNVAAGASTTPGVDSALAAAQTFFSTYTPANWPKAQKNTILSWASTLDQYNNGLIGPGHCDNEVV
jgi:uncharacterized repeat protein (TIGR01451 family)